VKNIKSDISQIKIPNSKLYEIFLSLQLMKYYYHLTKDLDSLNHTRNKYDDFVKQQFGDEQNNSFDCPPNIIAFSYLLLVRIIELINIYFKNDNLKTFCNEYWDAFRKNKSFQDFNDLLKSYGIEIIDNLIPNNIQSAENYMKWYYFSKNIRNSISHWRYKIEENTNIFTFKDRPSQNAKDNFCIKIQQFQLLNFTYETIDGLYNFILNSGKVDFEV
jgi:hypothetical protein